MWHYLIVILLYFHYVKCSSDIDLENSECFSSWEMEDNCSSYCFRMMRPLLGYAKQCTATEDEINGLKEQINNLTNKIKIQDQIIDNLRNEKLSQDKLNALETAVEELRSEAKIYKQSSELQQDSESKPKEDNEPQRDAVIDNPDNPLSCIPFGDSNQIQTINSFGNQSIDILCDSQTAGDGWTVIQKRIDGDVKFNRNWQEYKTGFGDLNGRFFIGLDQLHLITKDQSHELYIHLQDVEGTTKYAHYNYFAIGNEDKGYKLKFLGDYEGTAGDSLTDHFNMKFSTFDHNYDPNNNCAAWLNGGWWFNSCGFCNLNGVYKENGLTERFQGILWTTFNNDPSTSLTSVKMMIRPKIYSISKL